MFTGLSRRLLRFLREIKIQRRDSSSLTVYKLKYSWQPVKRGFQLSARLPWLIVTSISLLPTGEPNFIGEIKLVKSAHEMCIKVMDYR